MTGPEFSKCECRHCAGHIEFPAEAGGQSVPCPHCGQLTELPAQKKRPVPPLVIAIVLLVLISGTAIWFVLPDKNEPSATQNINPAAVTNLPAAKKNPGETVTNEFSISAVKLEQTPGSSLVYVTGKVRNLATHRRFGVKLEFALAATNAAPAGSATDYTPILEPGADWDFKALVLDSKAATAQFSSINESQ